MGEWLNPSDCKSDALRATQVRILLPPPRCDHLGNGDAHIAQAVEHVLGKNEVIGSSPIVGSICARGAGALLSGPAEPIGTEQAR